LESAEKLLGECGIVVGVAAKVKNIRRSCFRSEECWEGLLKI
jgi:hypothetical protein